MKHIAVFCATGLGVVLAACGSLDSSTGSAPTLATLQGSLALASPDSLGLSSSSDVRVAVVWRGDTPGKFSVAEDLPVQPVFPSSFTIALDGPPPEAAMNGPASPSGTPAPPVTAAAGGPPLPITAAAGGPPPDAGIDEAGAANSQPVMLLDTPAAAGVPSRYAIGTVVAYLDQNHNGKLDLVPDNATSYVDRILAADQELTIEYFEGPIGLTDTFGHGAKDGYNLLKSLFATWAGPRGPPTSALSRALPSATRVRACPRFSEWIPRTRSRSTPARPSRASCASSAITVRPWGRRRPAPPGPSIRACNRRSIRCPATRTSAAIPTARSIST